MQDALQENPQALMKEYEALRNQFLHRLEVALKDLAIIAKDEKLQEEVELFWTGQLDCQNI